MSSLSAWIRASVGALALSCAAYGCTSSDAGLTGLDAGEGTGGTAGGALGQGGAAGMGNPGPGTGGMMAPGGSGGRGMMSDAGAGGSQGTGGMMMGMGGSMGLGGRPPMPDGGMMPTQCEVGRACMGSQSCTAACMTGGGQMGELSCVCVGGSFFCGSCSRTGDAGLPSTDPPPCPQAPQAGKCKPSSPLCSYGQGAQAGSCVCANEQYFCPALPAPMEAPRCPNMPQGKSCNESNEICSASETTSCLCTSGGSGGGGRRWVCGVR